MNRPNLDFRGFCGSLASGVIRPGDEIVALPSRRRSKVERIVTFDGDLDRAHAPQAVTITLEDEIDIHVGTFSKALGFAELGGSFLPLAAAIPVLTLLSVLLLKKQAK